MKKSERKKNTFKVLKGKKSFKQIIVVIIVILLIIITVFVANIYHFKAISTDIMLLQEKLTKLQESNATRTPLIYENRDSERIFRDYETLDRAFKSIFTFRTLEDMAHAKTLAKEFGLSENTLNMLYDPNEILAENILIGGDVTQVINCYYSQSDIFLIDMGDDYYRYLCRISLDVLSDHNITLMLFLDIDKSGKVISDLCHISALPSSEVFK